MTQTERDWQFVEWLKNNQREGYVDVFLQLQATAPQVLGGLDNNDWISIFLKLPPASLRDPTLDLCAMFSAVSI
jgi:hypothetical protein